MITNRLFTRYKPIIQRVFDLFSRFNIIDKYYTIKAENKRNFTRNFKSIINYKTEKIVYYTKIKVKK